MTAQLDAGARGTRTPRARTMKYVSITSVVSAHGVARAAAHPAHASESNAPSTSFIASATARRRPADLTACTATACIEVRRLADTGGASRRARDASHQERSAIRIWSERASLRCSAKR